MNNLLYAIIFLVFFLIFNLKFKKSFSDPLILHTLTWLLVFIIGYFNYSDFYELNSFFWNSWLIWFSSFGLGYFLFNFRRKNRKVKIIDYVSIPDYSFFLNCITFVFFILTIVQGFTGGYGNFLMNLRLSFIFKTNTLLQPFLILFTFIWPMFLYEGVVYKNKKNLTSLILFTLVYTLASGGKFGILMVFSALFFILSHRKKIKKKFVILIASFGIGLIILMSFFREHVESSFVAYSYAPLVAYQSIENFHNIIWGHETFRFFYSMFYSLGLLDVKPPEDFYEYIMTPVMVNVYTAMRPFYSDFGFIGVFFGGLSYGLFFGYCYKGYLEGKLIQSALYFGYAFAIISIPFADLLFLNLSLILRSLIVILIVFVTINRKIKFIYK